MIRKTVLFASFTAFLASTTMFAAPALAVDCEAGQNVARTLDFKKGLTGPLLNIDLSVKSETCTDDAGSFQLEGLQLSKPFTSVEDVQRIFKLGRELRRLGYPIEDLKTLIDFAAKKEQEAAGNPQAVNAPTSARRR